MWLLRAGVCGCYVQGYVVATCRGMWLLRARVCGCYVQGYVVATCRGMWLLRAGVNVVDMCRGMCQQSLDHVGTKLYST